MQPFFTIKIGIEIVDKNQVMISMITLAVDIPKEQPIPSRYFISFRI